MVRIGCFNISMQSSNTFCFQHAVKGHNIVFFSILIALYHLLFDLPPIFCLSLTYGGFLKILHVEKDTRHKYSCPVYLDTSTGYNFR